jgi:hypothetical protein
MCEWIARGGGAYDPQAVLDLWYAEGDRYSYFDVPVAVYEGLLATDAVGQSAGEFVNRRIKSDYRVELVPAAAASFDRQGLRRRRSFIGPAQGSGNIPDFPR